MPDLIDGRQLMARAQAGDLDAFGELYSRYRGEVLAFRRRRHPQQAEDAVQDVFVRALGGLHRWTDQGKNPGAWLNTIAANVCHDMRRRASVRREEPRDELPEYDRDLQQCCNNPADLAVQDLIRHKVLLALAKLTKPQREAVVLFYLREMSLIEVADRTGSNVGAVKAALCRARRALAPLLAGVR